MDYPADEIKNVDDRRQDILKGLLKRLNDEVYAGWYGRQDAHTLYIWHESLILLDSDFVSLQVPTQPWRKTQYFLFQPADCSAPLHVYHCHCPSAGRKRKDNTKNRKLSEAARKQVVGTICQHAQQRHQALRRVGVAQPDFPAVLMMGDFNIGTTQWRLFLYKYLPDHVKPRVQVVKSTIVREHKWGDVAFSINCHALQDETPTWTRFSDAHDIVIARVSWPLRTPLPAGSAEQPAPAEKPSLQGAADSTTVPEAATADERPPVQMTHSTAAKPASAPAAAPAPAAPAPVPQSSAGQPALDTATTAPAAAPAAAATKITAAQQPHHQQQRQQQKHQQQQKQQQQQQQQVQQQQQRQQEASSSSSSSSSSSTRSSSSSRSRRRSSSSRSSSSNSKLAVLNSLQLLCSPRRSQRAVLNSLHQRNHAGTTFLMIYRLRTIWAFR